MCVFSDLYLVFSLLFVCP